MKINNFKIITIRNGIFLCAIVLSAFSYAQNGTLHINQDKDIEKLLALKKDMNSSEDASDRYRIQVYSGNRADAEASRSKVMTSYNNWKTSLVYETPNYKIWVGSFRTRLEADRALLKIKDKFPSAFIFKPKKQKA